MIHDVTSVLLVTVWLRVTVGSVEARSLVRGPQGPAGGDLNQLERGAGVCVNTSPSSCAALQPPACVCQ